MHVPKALGTIATMTAVALAATGCGSSGSDTADAGAKGGSGGGKVGIELPLLTSPFWQAYSTYVPQKAKELGMDALPAVNADSKPAQQITDIQNLLSQDVKGLVVAPLDSAAIGAALKLAERKKVPVVSVDVAPEKGKVAMVVRANNVAYGQKACTFLGDEIKSGKVVQIMGALSSINGRERSEAFRDCMKEKYPDMEVLQIPADWESEKAAAGLESLYAQNRDIKGIYMQAGGVYLAPTLQTLKRAGALKKAGQPGHIAIISNDGIPQELDAIRAGTIDATVSQPADTYAQYGLDYLKRAMAGETFKPGKTDHDSTIVKLPNGNLEDQLPAPLVTKENVDDEALWGNTVK
jgi:ribose transport system substrate-binding protein